MFYVKSDPTLDPWYNLGQIAGLALGNAFAARNTRESAKQREYLKSIDAAHEQAKANKAFQTAADTYTKKKTEGLGDLDTAYNAYNAHPTAETWNAAVAMSKKYDPNFDVSKGSTFQGLRDSMYSGSAGYLQPDRQATITAGQAINPNLDTKNSNWINDTSDYGTQKYNYLNDYQKAMNGKRMNGEGDNKFQYFSQYADNIPQYVPVEARGSQFQFSHQLPGVPRPNFGMYTPPAQPAQSVSAAQFTLPKATPLSQPLSFSNYLPQYQQK